MPKLILRVQFLGSKFTQSELVAGAPPQTSLLPDPLPISGAASRQGKGTGGERGRRERGKGYWGWERGREGKRGGEGGKGEGGGKRRGGGVCVIGVRGIDAPA